MCAMNMSSNAVDSRRTLASKLSPPGAIPPCPRTVFMMRVVCRRGERGREEEKIYVRM